MPFKIFTNLACRHFVCLLACVLFITTQAPQSAAAQEMNIGVVDIEKILSDSLAGKSIETQLKTRREAFQKEFTAREDNLMASQKTIIKQKSELSTEEFAVQRKNFENQLAETRNLFKKRRGSLDRGLGKALSSLRKHIVEVTAEVADERGIKIVMTRDSVVIVAKEMDITDTVLSRLNKKVSNITLKIQ